MKIPLSYIECRAWKNLPASSKAIYPVIYKFANSSGTAFPSELTIAIMAGVTEKTVRAGLNGLDSFPGFKRLKYITSRGHISYRYRIEPYGSKGKTFSISHAFFNGGNWSLLTPSAKAIYPVLKNFGFWDFELYREHEDSADDALPGNPYTSRLFDFLSPNLSAVEKFSGVNLKSVKSGYQSLRKYHFIEPLGIIDGKETYKIFVQPKKTFDVEYLNTRNEKRYGAMENITH